MRHADASAGSTVTTESISYATSTERTTIVSSYIGTATETTTASGPTQTVSGPTQTESGPTQTISGPTQTIQGPTQTQVITTSYVETYTTSYPVTETLPGECYWPLCSFSFFLGSTLHHPQPPSASVIPFVAQEILVLGTEADSEIRLYCRNHLLCYDNSRTNGRLIVHINGENQRHPDPGGDHDTSCLYALRHNYAAGRHYLRDGNRYCKQIIIK